MTGVQVQMVSRQYQEMQRVQISPSPVEQPEAEPSITVLEEPTLQHLDLDF
jgi:hypothetical protein